MRFVSIGRPRPRRDDPGRERDRLAGQPVRIAGAVEPLVMMPDRRDGGLELAHHLDHLRAGRRVAAHQHPLLVGQAGRLHQDLVGDRQLPDVVEERRVGERDQLLSGQPEPLADGERDPAHASRVPAVYGHACGRSLRGAARCSSARAPVWSGSR
jgi:hypothetical protein